MVDGLEVEKVVTSSACQYPYSFFSFAFSTLKAFMLLQRGDRRDCIVNGNFTQKILREKFFPSAFPFPQPQEHQRKWLTLCHGHVEMETTNGIEAVEKWCHWITMPCYCWHRQHRQTQCHPSPSQCHPHWCQWE